MSQVTEKYKRLIAALKNPFDPDLVKWTTKGDKSPKPLAYIDARDIMKRLDDVLGAENYQTKFIPVDDGFICELSLKIDGEWITRSDGANRTRIEPVKGGISDALKRAGNAWGVGRYLYYLPSWANGDNIDKWPEWAKPDSDLENWEDIAEAEAGKDTGIDVFNEDNIPEGAELVWACDSEKDLKKLILSLGDEQAIALADDINAKRRELFHASNIQSNTDKPSSKKS